MIALIGLLLSAYVFTRMLDIIGQLSDPRPGWTKVVLAFAAIVTTLLALLVGFDMFLRLVEGNTTP